MTLEDLALTFTPGIGVKGAIHLLETFGDAQRIFAATTDELIRKAELRPDIARKILDRSGFADAEQETVYCRKHNIQIVASTDDEYPPLLRECSDYPHILYIRGDLQAVHRRCISFVGTREATPYGQRICNRLIEELAELVPDLCIVSGMAFGIDVTAHRAALAAGIPTIGILANVLPEVAPTAHEAVARDVLDHGGALVTELHSQSRQKGTFYPARNRIIAALSAGTVVIESKVAGGALITAQYADGYNRTVMAIPGRVGDPASGGTNHLIRTRKAQIVRSAQDIVEELAWELGLNPAIKYSKPNLPELTPPEAALLACFTTPEPMSFDRLGELSNLNPGELSSLLVGLELSGAISPMPGNLYTKLPEC